MRTVKAVPKTVDDYLAKVPPERAKLLQSLRKTILSIVPKAEECISYGMPAFRLGGQVVAGFAATSSGASYYPFSGSTLDSVSEKIRAYSRTKAALHFVDPLPSQLVRHLIAARKQEIRAVAEARETKATRKPSGRAKGRTKASARP